MPLAPLASPQGDNMKAYELAKAEGPLAGNWLDGPAKVDEIKARYPYPAE